MPEHLRASPDPILLFMRMTPPWVFIDEIRRFVQSFCSCAALGRDRESQVALATHELVQNAITNAGGEAEIELSLAVCPGSDQVRIEVSNACGEHQAEALSQRVAAISREPDAMKMYVEEMRQAPLDRRGGLGLPRVRAEAQLELDVTYEGGRVTVTASGKLVPPALMEGTVNA